MVSELIEQTDDNMFLQRTRFLWPCEHPLHATYRVMQRTLLNCIGIFGTPLSAILAVYIPAECKP
jgi:hypothetical protein